MNRRQLLFGAAAAAAMPAKAAPPLGWTPAPVIHPGDVLVLDNGSYMVATAYSAGRNYGKSFMLAEWIKRQPGPVVDMARRVLEDAGD